MRRGIGRLRAGGSGGFNPRSALWPLGTEAGMWLDPSDSATGYQNSIGTTAGVVDSPIGLRLDKRFGLARDADVTNGGFDADTAWTKGGGWNIGSGTANYPLDVGGTDLTETSPVTLAVGDFVEVSFTVNAISTGNVYPLVAGAVQDLGQVKGTTGSYSCVVKITAVTNQLVGVRAGNSPSGISIDNLSIRRIRGNHVLQATSAARPTWKLNGAIYSDLDDGVDDLYSTNSFVAGTLTADMDCFIAIKRVSTAVLLWESGPKYFGAAGASGVKCDASVGSASTYYVDGVAVPGGVATTEAQLGTALTAGAWHVAEVRNLDLSTFTSAKFGFYSASFTGNADIGGVILCPAQSTANRNSIRTYLGAKVGLSL